MYNCPEFFESNTNQQVVVIDQIFNGGNIKELQSNISYNNKLNLVLFDDQKQSLESI